MLNRKPYSDWTTPKPATARSSPLLNDQLGLIKKGLIKAGETNNKFDMHIASKEHAIDSSITTPLSSIEEEQLARRGHQREIPPPRSNVHMLPKSQSQYDQSGTGGTSYDALWATMRSQNAPLSVISSSYLKPTADLNNPTYSTANSVKDLSYSDKIRYYTTNTNTRIAQHPLSAQKQRPDMPTSNITELGSLEAVRLVHTKSNATSVYQAASSRQLLQDENGRYIDKRNNAVKMSSNQYLANPKQNSSGTLEYSSNPALMQIHALAGASSLMPVDNKASAKSDGPGKWDHVMNAKDDLIRQKDIIIARQKQTIEQLQQHIRDIEERINQNSFKMIAQRKDEKKHETALKEAECQISQLKAQLQNLANTKQEEIEKLQRKLGATEYELQKLEKGFKDVGSGQAKEIAELKQKIEERGTADQSMKKSLEALQEDLRKERRKAQSLQQYLQDLPTAEEHNKSLQQIKESKTEKQKLEETIESLEKRLRSMKDEVKQRDSSLEQERASREEAGNELKRMSDHLDRYKAREKDGPVTLEEFDEVKWENERLKAECERIQKVLEQKHKKMKALHQQSQDTVKALEERLTQEEDTVNVLRKDVETKDKALEDMKSSVKQISSKNQDLMRDNLTLKEIHQEVDRLTSPEVQQAHFQVHKELSSCVVEIKRLIDICSETAEGRDPNMSALLGIKGHAGSPMDDSNELPHDPFGIDSAKVKLTKIRQLRSEIDKLRTFVSDKYAEEVGNNCVTQ
eukprot:Seg2521.5_Seg2521.6 transcript_id=Seg2521.5_Seg2521.6/GoldUCD/mRNA.D3Y31 product="Centrosomal protein of 85 kDa" protein_id=Seg2521.5_Seg2521.6/GoldUCD/D3Y31